MKAIKTLAIIAISGAIASTSVSAQGMKHGKGCEDQINRQECKEHRGTKDRDKMHKKHNRKNSNKMIYRAFKKLDLTDEQKSELKDIRKSMKKSYKQKRKEHKGFMNIKEFITTDGFKKDEFIAAAENKATEMAKVKANMIEKAIAILTPEQRLKLVDNIKKKDERRKQHKK
ncbi:MAG: hypothetical protein HF962_03785 [Sulfurovum sp.]|nr:hypothetical protein [Sulfurovum sp.]